MSINIQGKTNLLTGFYKNIIINKTKDNNIVIKIKPDEKYPVDRVDKSYTHLDLPSNLTEDEIINLIIDYYLNNNTLKTCMISDKLKSYQGKFMGLNTWSNPIDGLVPLYRSLIINEELLKNDILAKIYKKYYLDLSRSFEKILEKKFININMSDFFGCNLIEDDTSNIVLLGEHIYSYKKENKLKNEDEEFLTSLLNYVFSASPTSFHYITSAVYFINDKYQVKISEQLPLKKIMNLFYEYKNMRQKDDQITIDEYVRTR